MTITPPAEGEDVRILWRKVAECVAVLNAIQNMTVVVEGQVKMDGQLDVSGQNARLRIIEHTEVQG